MSTPWTFRPGPTTFQINQTYAFGRLTSHLAFYGAVTWVCLTFDLCDYWITRYVEMN